MKLKVLRYSGGDDTTLGVLLDVTHNTSRFLCYTLEDEGRDVKVAGETRIPSGEYKVTLRTVGGKHAKYKRRFPDMHKGMLWVRGVPGFTYVLIHIGNTEDDTEGCLLLGSSSVQNVTKAGSIGASRVAYERVYPQIANALAAGVEVTIQYVDP